MPVLRLALLGDLDAIAIQPFDCQVLARSGVSAAEVLAVQVPELERISVDAVQVHLGPADLAFADESAFHADVVALCDRLLCETWNVYSRRTALPVTLSSLTLPVLGCIGSSLRRKHSQLYPSEKTMACTTSRNASTRRRSPLCR